MMGTTYRVVDDKGEEWLVGLFEGLPVPRYITIEGTRYQVVDPASTVVLDPNNPDDVARLREAFWDGDEQRTYRAALRSLLPVVTPPEPNGLGAVVLRRSDGALLRRHGDGWQIIDKALGSDTAWTNYTWSADDVVISHGHGCTCGAPDCNGGGA